MFLQFRQSFGVSLKAETFQNILYPILTPTPFASEVFCVYKTMQNRKLLKFYGLLGHTAVQSVETPHYKPESRGFYSRWCQNFSLTSFWPHYGAGFDSASNRNEYRNIFGVVKAAGE